jgi:RimJ/RimL family protein N-acetyltransferase
MNTSQAKIPELTVETFARSFYKEALTYGFQQVDYIRFVNLLLDCSMANNKVIENTATREEDPQTPISILNLTNLPVKSERLIIRAYNPNEDAELFKTWLNDEAGRHFLLSQVTAKTQDFDELFADSTNIFGVITLHDSTPIGSLAFLNYDAYQKKAELRKLIGEAEMRGKGFAKEATKLWIDYGLRVLGIKKIYLNTLNTHIRNIKLNEELGFQVEGILRNEVYFDGEYHDVLRMGLWND